MIGVTLLRAADRRPQPWKNGGGVTSEVIASPPGCGVTQFSWRVSIAEVATEGSFSRFEGVDRVLTVLEGELILKIGACDAVRLTPESPPHGFPGDVAADGAPIGGVVRALNVMSRRGQWGADVRRISVTKELKTIRPQGDATLAVGCGDLSAVGRGWKYDLAVLDALFVEATQEFYLSSRYNVRAVCLCFSRIHQERPL